MKYVIYGFLALPLVALASCTVADEHYHSPNYYVPTARVEAPRYYPDARYHRPMHRHQHVGYLRYSPQPRIYHGHRPVRNNTVVVKPRQPQARVEVQSNAHGHSINPGVVVRRQPSDAANVKGHIPTVQSHGKSQAIPQKRHGHS